MVLVFGLYGSSLNNDYNIDDDLVTGNNSIVSKGVSAIPEIFTSPYRTGRDFSYGYRPVAKSLFAVEYEIFGKNPFVGHLVNLLLYAFSCILLFNVLILLFNKYSSLFSFFVVLVFLVHPLHTEVVLSLKNREDILSTLFSLLSLLLFVRYTYSKRIINIVFAVFCFILAYLSKESALVFAAIIPLSLYYFTDFKFSKSVLYFVLLFVLIFIVRKYVSMALPDNKVSLFVENPLFEKNNFIERFPTSMSSLLYYLKLMFVPFPLRFYYGYNMLPVVDIKDFVVLVSILVHIIMIIFALKGLKKKTVLSYSIFFYLISISMFSNILVPVNGIIAERLAYVATIGFSIFVVYLVFRLLGVDCCNMHIKNKKEQYAVFVFLFFLIPFSVISVQRVPVWKNNYTLVENDIKYLENSFVANELYARQLLFRQENPENVKQNIGLIKKHYDKCIDLYPDFYRVWNNLGFIESVVYRNYDKAVLYFNRALELKPKYPEALFQLGFVYEMKKDYIKAVEYYEKAVEIDTAYVEALSKLANWNNKTGNYKKAFEFNIKILHINPRSDVPFINTGNYFYLKSDFDNAIKFWKIAVRQNPDNYRLILNIANLYKSKGDFGNANIYYNKAQRIKRKK